MVYVGGFLDSPSFPVARTIAPAYKTLGASIYTRAVGKHAAEMLANLTNTGLDPKALELYQPGDVIWMPCNTLCSHIRSFTIWIAALQNQDSFIGIQCDSVQHAREKNCYDRTPQVTNLMGLKTDRRKEGIFFLATDNNYPYALGKKGLKKENEFFSSLMKNMEARISKRSLRHLYFLHLQKGNFLTANRTQYNYFQMKQLAKKMDFSKKTVLFMAGYLDSSDLLSIAPAMGGLYTRKGYNMLAELAGQGLDPKKLEIIGISHGGQGISFIAKSYRSITGRNVSRITGLDPSGPCFRRLGPEDRIDASDADLVDIIHTNIEGYGFTGAVGHVNFYVNGGEFQSADIADFPCTNACSHSKSFLLWVAAMQYPDLFIGLKCDSVQDARDRNCFEGPLVTNLMGPNTDVNKPGIFYLATLNYFPYYLGKKGLDRNFDFLKSYLADLNEVDVLRHLYFLHLQTGNFMTANRTQYNYYQMKQLAKQMDFSKKTVLFMGGYLDSAVLYPISPAMGGLYTRKGYNVLLLEYIQFTTVMYPVAARLLRPVGKAAAEMLAELAGQGLDPKKLEIIGLSHGGQGVSFIAKSYRRITGRNVSRITALDPSGPCFRRLGPEDRIDASDADLVDIIHTNIDGYGFAGAVGHVNFYVNGGEFQSADIADFPCTSFCSHSKSLLLWFSAMQYPDLFIGFKCDSVQDARDRNCFEGPLVTNVMGPNTDVNKPGIFYLATLNYFPYYLGKKGIDKEVDFHKSFISDLNKVDVLVV
ncbi:Uncharacterized protein OBRU01_08153 [Operophtera brumata]|uniref:Lipase domain-containing protein n=1 Tax=Operophtera brumata TaxID=104452 RepID=A0A0L7LHY6_OPEBR|nr:Uncharacterized protein OBRU01_08153 [Operophtera brumata]